MGLISLVDIPCILFLLPKLLLLQESTVMYMSTLKSKTLRRLGAGGGIPPRATISSLIINLHSPFTTYTMIVKEIVERPASSSNPLPPQPPKPSAHKNGFPIPKRRPVRPAAASTPTPKPISSHDFGEQLPHINFQHPYGAQSPEDAQMERENLARVQAMSEQERSEEKAELMERFGPGLMDLMRKRKAQREAQVSSQAGPSRLREVNMVRQEVDEENRKQVQSMSASDRESEVNDLEQRFGAATLAAIKRRAEARQRPGGDSGPNGAPKGEPDHRRR